MLPNSIFRAYDIRGKYPGEINEEIASEIVSKFFFNLKPKTSNLKVVIGHDTRLSSPPIYKAALDSLKIKNLKLEIIPAGLITTPMLYFLVNDLKADYGIMVTASHNPKEFNGLKVVGKKAKPISGTKIYKIISKFNSPNKGSIPKS